MLISSLRPEFIDVGKKPEALEILCDVLKSRKHRVWQKQHTEIMLKYLELCVELRKSYIAKEGIYQYKIICQQPQIKAFEDVVRKYLELAEEKAEAAREEAQAASTVLDVDDLDNLQTPENLLLSAVSSEVSQDRTDRVLLLPWVKFLWESYRQCLDLLRNNARTERLYHDIAQKAFQFCIKFQRKTEFRKLCDNLHLHLDNLKKQQIVVAQQQNLVNLSNPESQAMHLETRLQQLDCAITMELWQEAYKATDDIKRFGLMNLSKKPLKPQLMASYYQKLALVFQKANCPIFHSAALLKHFILTRELRKNVKEEDLQKLASRVVAASLAVPIPPTRPEIDKLVDTEENVIENHHRNLASLLGLSTVIPNRSSLIRDLKRMNVLNYAVPELQQLYLCLEVDFEPLTLCKKVASITETLSTQEHFTDLRVYIPALKDVTLVRLLKEIAQVYSSIELRRLSELCPFADPITLEVIVVNAARRNDVQIRIDHRRNCLHFGGVFMPQAEEITEGPFLQSMPSSQFRQQLVNVYSVLQKARSIIDTDAVKNQRNEFKKRVMLNYENNKVEKHHEILKRQDYIEEKKEELEQKSLEREENERRLVEEQQLHKRLQEEERMKREMEDRLQMRKLQESEELKRRMALDTIETLRSTEAGQKILEIYNEKDLYDLKLDEIRSKQYEQLEKERREQLARQQKLEKKIDHIERAKRIEEIPLLLEQYEKEKKENKEIWEKLEKERIEQLIADHKLALEHKDRLLRMSDEASKFSAEVEKSRANEYQKRLEEWQVRFEALKRERLAERAVKRKEERRHKYLRELREKEEEKRRAEERARKEAEDERARKQRQKEEEIEAKLQAEQLKFRDAPPTREIPRRDERKTETSSWRDAIPANRDLPPTRTLRTRDGPSGFSEDNWRDKKDDQPTVAPETKAWRPRRLQEANSDDHAPPPPAPTRVIPPRVIPPLPGRDERRLDDRRGDDRRMDDRRDDRRFDDRRMGDIRDDRRMGDRRMDSGRDERRMDDRGGMDDRRGDPRRRDENRDFRRPEREEREMDWSRGDKDAPPPASSGFNRRAPPTRSGGGFNNREPRDFRDIRR